MESVRSISLTLSRKAIRLGQTHKSFTQSARQATLNPPPREVMNLLLDNLADILYSLI